MNKKQPFKSFFSPIAGLLLTMLLFGIEKQFPLHKIIGSGPKGTSWIELASLYWLYFSLYNGAFFIKEDNALFFKKKTSIKLRELRIYLGLQCVSQIHLFVHSHGDLSKCPLLKDLLSKYP